MCGRKFGPERLITRSEGNVLYELDGQSALALYKVRESGRYDVQTLLTTVVSVDKIYVEFEGDEQVYLKYAALARKGEVTNSRDSSAPSS